MTTTATDADDPTTAPLGIPSWLVLFIIAATPVVFATGFSEFEAVKQFTLVLGAGLAFVTWGATLLYRGRVGLVAGRVVSLLAAFGGYVAVSMFWAPEVLYGAVHANHFLALVAVVIILSAPLERPVRFFDFALAVSLGIAISGLFGIIDMVGVEVFTQVWDPRGATGAFGAMEFAVAYYAVALPVALAATQYTEGWSRILFGVASVLGAAHFGMVVDWTFISMFVGVSVVVVALILAFEGVETSTVLAPVGAMVAFVVLVAFGAGQFVDIADDPTEATALPSLERGEGINEQAVEDKELRNPAFAIGRMESVRSMEVRSYLAGISFELFQERPFVGRGAGAWWRLQTKQPNIDHPAAQQRFVHYPAYRSPHNVWSKLSVEYGVVGLALFVLWLAGCVAIGLGALGRSGEKSDLIVEQWGLWATMLGGLVFATVTPLMELAGPAVVWFAAVALLTRRSAEVNGYTGASMRWAIGEGRGAPRMAAAAVAVVLGLGIATVSSVNTVSKLHRGWADHLMLRTYFDRAIDQYQTADSWMPVHGDVIYNIARAKSKLGDLNANVTETMHEAQRQAKRKAGDGGGESGEQPAPGADESSDQGSGSAEGRTSDAGTTSDPRADRELPSGEKAARSGAKAKRGDRPSRRELVKKSDAYKLLQRAVEMRPYDARVLDLSARFFVRWQFRGEALRRARRAVDAFPNGVSARKTLATTLRAQGKLEAATKELLTLIEHSPPEDELHSLHLHVGQLYMNFLEEYANAKEHFESARAVAPSSGAEKRAADMLKKVEHKIENQRRKRQGKPPKEFEEKAPRRGPGGPGGPGMPGGPGGPRMPGGAGGTGGPGGGGMPTPPSGPGGN